MENKPKFKIGDEIFVVSRSVSDCEITITRLTVKKYSSELNRVWCQDVFGNTDWRDDFYRLLTKSEAEQKIKEFLNT